jgi:hypothetical protein
LATSSVAPLLVKLHLKPNDRTVRASTPPFPRDLDPREVLSESGAVEYKNQQEPKEKMGL